MSRTFDVLATTGAAAVGATIAVLAVGGRPVFILPIAVAIGLMATLTRGHLDRTRSRVS